ncbi:MAG: DNA polymerase III subunit epsilon [Betaproteobacteria bacterium]|nr:DNA polymerase III subunit epsilon [Betaproteobacteria bacterium]
MLDSPLVFVDLETTGANPAFDRVIEVGIVKVSGGQLEYEWSTLVDPGEPIPPVIQGFTGISDAMVRGAPSFAAIADEVFARIEGSVFVAHNARFDYGFLKNEFGRLDLAFQPRVLCTVKLSRALYPEHHRHGLDALIARHGLACDARHRALGDARVLWDFVQLVQAEKPAEAIQAALKKATKSPSLPSGLEATAVDAVPEAPGVYLFLGENELPLYIGKAVNLRSRVQSHFAADHGSGRAMRIAQEVKRIEWIETAGELGALLLEARLIKARQPIHNRRLRKNEELCAFRLIEGGDVVLERVPPAGVPAGELGELYGQFKSKREAHNTLRELAAEHGLCLRRLGLEQGKGPCFNHQIKRCKGWCAGKESAEKHDLRLKAALAVLKLRAWPFPGRIAIREHGERDEAGGRCEWHLFEQWCHLGTAKSEAELHEAAQARTDAAFDLDTYRILRRELDKRAGTIDILRLDAPSFPRKRESMETT